MTEKLVLIMDWINKKTLTLVVILFFIAFAMLLAQITSRYVLKVPFLMGDEVSRYATVWIVYLGAGIAARHNRLIKMEVLLSVMPAIESRKQIVDWVSGIISVVFYFFIIKYGIQMMGLAKMQISPVLGLSMAIPYSALPVGSLLLIANTIACLLDNGKTATNDGTISFGETSVGEGL